MASDPYWDDKERRVLKALEAIERQQIQTAKWSKAIATNTTIIAVVAILYAVATVGGCALSVGP